MLNKEQMEELRNAVDSIDLIKAIQDAKYMGIEVTKKDLGYHGSIDFMTPNEYEILSRAN